MNTLQADSFFEYSTLENHFHCVICSENEAVTPEDACTQRMLGITESLLTNLTVECIKVRISLKSILNLNLYNLPSRSLTNLHITEDNICFHEACCKAVILNYIHNQDGKK